MKKIFIIAGEASGDYLAGRLMEDLRKICSDSIEFFGVGGSCMEKAGLRKLFSINELSIMGIVEVIGKIFRVKRLIDKTVNAIFIFDPDIIITIDSSGFTHRVDRKIKAQLATISDNDKTRVQHAPIIHYVAPPVWAWRAWRAKSMHEFIDKLLVLLPFEPELFNKYGLETVFVGHPIALDPDFEKPNDFCLEDFKDALSQRDNDCTTGVLLNKACVVRTEAKTGPASCWVAEQKTPALQVPLVQLGRLCCCLEVEWRKYQGICRFWRNLPT